jgi:hypothetical protein
MTGRPGEFRIALLFAFALGILCFGAAAVASHFITT